MITRCHAIGLVILTVGLVAGSAFAAPKQYSVVLAGTVNQVGASSVDGVPPSESTLTVNVLRVLMPSWQTAVYPNDLVTVQLESKATFKPGNAILVFGDGWIYANNVALRALARPATKSALKATIAEINRSEDPEFDVDLHNSASLASATETTSAPNNVADVQPLVMASQSQRTKLDALRLTVEPQNIAPSEVGSGSGDGVDAAAGVPRVNDRVYTATSPDGVAESETSEPQAPPAESVKASTAAEEWHTVETGSGDSQRSGEATVEVEQQEAALITIEDLDAMQQVLETADLRKRVVSADLIIEGEISKIAPLSDKHQKLLRTRLASGEQPISEHDAGWGEAEIRVKATLKGAQARKILVIFPQKNDIAYTHGPRYRRGQHGVFFLHEQQILAIELPDGVTSTSTTRQPAMSLDRRDYLSSEFVKLVQQIVAEPKTTNMRKE